MLAQALVGGSGSQVWQVLATPWRQLGPVSRWVWGGVVLLLTLLVGWGAAADWSGKGQGLLGSYVCVVLAISWSAQLSSLFEQNQPVSAHLVPGHAALLRRVTLALWLALTLIGALVMSATALSAVSPPLLLLGSAAVLTLMCVMTRWWMLWILIWLLPALFTALGLHKLTMPVWTQLRELWLANPWSGTGAALLLMGWGQWHLFGNGDAAHVASYRQMDRMRRAQRLANNGQRQGWAVFGAAGEAVGRPFERLPNLWLAHLIRRAQPRHASVMARAEVVLHGSQHWLRHLVGVGATLALVVLVFAVALSLGGEHLEKGFWINGAFGISIGLCSASLNPGFMLPGSLWQSRREQALLCLLPGMPRGRSLNRAIAWRQARHVGLAWLLTTAALFGLAYKSGDAWLLCLGAGALPVIAAWLWRSPARLQAPTGWGNAAPILIYMVLALALYAGQRATQWPVWPMLVGSLALSAALAAWRWRRLNAAPSALPAGRLG